MVQRFHRTCMAVALGGCAALAAVGLILGGFHPDDTVGMLIGVLLLIALVVGVIGWQTYRGPPALRQLHAYTEACINLRSPSPLSLRVPDEWGELTIEVARVAQAWQEAVETLQVYHAQAEAADNYKQVFFETLRHELRTPLNAVMGFSDVLLQDIDGPLPEEHRSSVQTIGQAGQHLRQIFDNVIDLSAADAGWLTLERQVVEVERMVQEAVLAASPAQPGSVSCEVTIAPDLPAVNVDPLRIRQILVNLIGNAFKFTSAGHIHVHAFRIDTGVRLEVTDTGIGIAPEVLPHIFDHFVQAETSRTQQGSGLGLAISQRLAELHGSHLEVQSELGQGTRFAFDLPPAADS